MATSIKVAEWLATQRRLVDAMREACYAAKALVAMNDAILADAMRLVALAIHREGGTNATRLLRDDIVQAESRFNSYRTALEEVGDKRDVDSMVRCESVVGYLLDGRTGDGTAPTLPQPDAAAAAALWNRAHVLTRTLAPKEPDDDALAIVRDAADKGAAAVADAGSAIKDAADKARGWVEQTAADIAEKATNIALLIFGGAGLALVLYLLLRK